MLLSFTNTECKTTSSIF